MTRERLNVEPRAYLNGERFTVPYAHVTFGYRDQLRTRTNLEYEMYTYEQWFCLSLFPTS